MTNSQSEAPIFVTGMPRSGTTFVQNLLSSHPEIEIHGQEPRFFVWESWLRAAVEGVDFAADANAGLEDVCRHYAAPEDADEVIRRMLQFVRWYLTGGQESRRWGVKSLADCRQAADLIQRVWPLARWVV